ncbi:MAG TPA: UDP-N-acetylmuramoyl-tripeptide--D-alanyl-D-alanine ligase [Bacillota bacterium]|nr:UDP-N-acetylmuramoyl-tripeptide--D-alanyl-D-alanine ligase [Bacillota bacterium]
MLTLEQICDAAGGTLLSGRPDQSITSFHFDTRQLTRDSLFVALTSGERDGHQFLQEAKIQGAIAALISNPDYQTEEIELAYILVDNTEKAFAKIAHYYRNQLHIPVIAVTGSNGKTTTKDMIAHVLGSKKNVFKTYKNYNNHLGVPLSILQINQDHELAVIEMGMNHPGEIDFLASIGKPDISVITNVTDAHIEYLGSRENIAKAKGELLPHTSSNGFAILNGDNPYVHSVSHLNPGQTYFYRLNEEADIYATDIATTDAGTSFTVNIGEESFTCSIPMFGLHNVSNLLPAIFIANHFGYNHKEITQALTNLSISPMRFELVQHNGDAVIINDAYNASPTSMKSSIQTFAEILSSYKRILVLGDMFELGERSIAFHQEVGSYINQLAERFEWLVTVGENSQYISSEAHIPSRHFTSKSDATNFLANYMDGGHAFLFKGSRGMKLEELVNHLLNR